MRFRTRSFANAKKCVPLQCVFIVLDLRLTKVGVRRDSFFFVHPFQLSPIFHTFVSTIKDKMIVCIAEKPSVARDIADVLGLKSKRRIHRRKRIPGYLDVWSFVHIKSRTNTLLPGNHGT